MGETILVWSLVASLGFLGLITGWAMRKASP